MSTDETTDRTEAVPAAAAEENPRDKMDPIDDPILARLHEKMIDDPILARLHEKIKEDLLRLELAAPKSKKETNNAKKGAIELRKAAAMEIKAGKIIKKFYQFYKDYENEEYNRVKAKVSDLC